MNFELLTMLYYYFKRHETYDRLDEFILALSALYKKEKFFGAIVNLYFKDDENIKEQLDIKQFELNNISTIFKNSIQLLDNLKTLEIIPEDVNFLYGIEGFNHIEDETKLNELYNQGLRVISSSNLNEYCELTDKDIELIKSAIELGIVININKTTYESLNKVIDLINENLDKNPLVIFSEDNVDMLKESRSAPYYILVTQNKDEKTKEEKEISFINRIKRIKENLFFSENKIILCKTDRKFIPKIELPILNSNENSSTYLRKNLANEFGIEFTNQIMYKNADEIFEKVLNNNKKKQKYIA